jgi:hypothetical protein
MKAFRLVCIHALLTTGICGCGGPDGVHDPVCTDGGADGRLFCGRTCCDYPCVAVRDQQCSVEDDIDCVYPEGIGGSSDAVELVCRKGTITGSYWPPQDASPPLDIATKVDDANRNGDLNLGTSDASDMAIADLSFFDLVDDGGANGVSVDLVP